MLNNFLYMLLLNSFINPFIPSVALNISVYTGITILILPPYCCHLYASSRNDFWVEVEAKRQLKRIIAKLKSELVEAVLARVVCMFLTKALYISIW